MKRILIVLSLNCILVAHALAVPYEAAPLHRHTPRRPSDAKAEFIPNTPEGAHKRAYSPTFAQASAKAKTTAMKRQNKRPSRTAETSEDFARRVDSQNIAAAHVNLPAVEARSEEFEMRSKHRTLTPNQIAESAAISMPEQQTSATAPAGTVLPGVQTWGGKIAQEIAQSEKEEAEQRAVTEKIGRQTEAEYGRILHGND